MPGQPGVPSAVGYAKADEQQAAASSSSTATASPNATLPASQFASTPVTTSRHATAGARANEMNRAAASQRAESKKSKGASRKAKQKEEQDPWGAAEDAILSDMEEHMNDVSAGDLVDPYNAERKKALGPLKKIIMRAALKGLMDGIRKLIPQIVQDATDFVVAQWERERRDPTTLRPVSKDGEDVPLTKEEQEQLAQIQYEEKWAQNPVYNPDHPDYNKPEYVKIRRAHRKGDPDFDTPEFRRIREEWKLPIRW